MGWYRYPSPPLSARSGPDPLGGHCCSSHICWQTGENPCGLPLTFPPIDRSGPDRLFGGGLPVLMVGDLNAKQRGLELPADKEMGETSK